MRSRPLLPLALLALAAGPAHAQVPELLEVQGRLESAAGVPLTAPTTVTFRLYDVPSGGAALHTEEDSVAPDSRGIFTATLGDGVALDRRDFGEALYLGVTVAPDPEMTPRLPLRAAPYALRAAPLPQVVEVAHDGDDAASGAALLAALAGISDASAAKPYLLRIGPGVFDLASSNLVMKPFVDVAGAGRNATWLRSTGQSDHQLGTVVLANSAELSSLGIRNVGGAFGAQGIYANGAGGTVDGVPVNASDESAVVRDVTVHSSGSTVDRGLEAEAGADVTVLGSYFLVESAGTQAAAGLEAGGAGTVLTVHGSKVEVVASGTCDCRGISMGSGMEGELKAVDVAVSNFGTDARAVFLSGGSFRLHGVTASVEAFAGSSTLAGLQITSGGGANAVESVGSSFVASSSGGTAIGVLAGGAGDLVRLVGGSFVGEGAGTSLGVRVTAGTTHLVGARVVGATGAADVDGGTLEVVGSRLEGGAPTNDGGTLRLGSSMIETSPVTNAGTTTCHACFDASFSNGGAIGDCP